MTIEGIDISHHQPDAVWPDVKKAGIKFSIARATYGTRPDRTFPAHTLGARSVGIIPGAYHFFRFPSPGMTAADQARAFLAALDSVGLSATSEYFVALDLEANVDFDGVEVNASNRARYVEEALSWLRIVEAQLGRPCLIYTYYWFWIQMGEPSAIAAGRPLWLADYSPVRIDLPRDWRRYHILQYTGEGRVEGFGNRDVDRNIFHGSLDDLHAAASGRWTDLPDDRPVSSHAQTVKAIQRALNAGGATPPLVEDGLPGPKTRAALAKVGL